MAAEHGSTLRIVLVGHTGAGKSSSGNTILAEEAFKAECCSIAVTELCEEKQGKVENKDVLVVDTPGLNDAEMSQEKLKSEIGKCIKMCAPGPHAFLLVIRLTRFTEEQQAAVKWIQENFGEGALKYTIVLFTGKDDLGGKSVEKFISESSSLLQVVHNCGGRYHAFNNRAGSTRQVTDLFGKIENMLKINNADYYTKAMYRHTQEINDQKEKERKENDDKQVKDCVKKIEREALRRHLVAGGSAGGGAIGMVVGLKYAGPNAARIAKAGYALGGAVTGAVVGFVLGTGINHVVDPIINDYETIGNYLKKKKD